MATSETSWTILASATVVFSAIATLAVAIYHFIFKKAQRKTTEDSRYTLINNRVATLEQRFNDLETGIQDYRKNQSDKLDKIIENQGKLANDVAFIKGKMEGQNHD